MPTYDLAYLITQFHKLFPEVVTDKDNILYRTSTKHPNTLYVDFKNDPKPTMVFVYIDREKFKYMTKKCHDEEEKALLTMRTELTKLQKTLRSERRSKTNGKA